LATGRSNSAAAAVSAIAAAAVRGLQATNSMRLPSALPVPRIRHHSRSNGQRHAGQTAIGGMPTDPKTVALSRIRPLAATAPARNSPPGTSTIGYSRTESPHYQYLTMGRKIVTILLIAIAFWGLRKLWRGMQASAAR